MTKRKAAAPAEVCRFDRYQRTVTVRPLFGMERLVKVQRRKQRGVLLCDSVTNMADTVAISKSNRKSWPIDLNYSTAFGGFVGEPRMSAPNLAPAADMERFYDYGKEFKYKFEACGGTTYSISSDVYRPLESYHSGVYCQMTEGTWVGTYALTVDLSAYLQAGFSIDTPLCEFRSNPASAGRKNGAKPTARRLRPALRGEGRWEWRVESMEGGEIRAAWEVEDRDPRRAFRAIDIDALATELSVNPSIAKDLHNFVSLCQFYAAGIRSLNAVDNKLLTSKTALWRSLESVEQMIGVELIERTRGKGLVRITPAGEAALEWWSRYYMRWTPMSVDLIGMS